MFERGAHHPLTSAGPAGRIALLLLTFAVAGEAQQHRTVQMHITQVTWPDSAARKAQLFSRLEEELNRPRIPFRTVTHDPRRERRCARVRASDTVGHTPNVGTGTPPPPPNVYDLCVRVSRHEGELRAAVLVLDDSGRVAEWFEVSDDPRKSDPLVDAIVDRLVIALTKSVRIAILDFPMVGGDTAQFGSFRRSLPSMLATGLILSNRMVLIEGTEGEKLLDSVKRAERGITNPFAALNLAKRLNANYYVMGEYFELKGEMRIDIRCVSIESREVIVTRGITIHKIALRPIEERMAQLAAELRSAIEADFIERSSRPRYLAVGALPPDPPLPENRKMLQQLVRTTASKLRHYQRGDPRVRQSHELLRTLTDSVHTRWAMSQLLEADILVTMTVDLTRRDEVVIQADVFDQDRPHEFEPYEKHGPATEVDSLLNELVEVLQVRLWGGRRASADSGSAADSALVRARQRSQEIKYRRPHPQLAGRVSLGIAVQNDTVLLLGTRSAGVLEVGAAWIPGSAYWQYTPTVRFAFYGSRGGSAQRAFGADAFVSAIYNVRPYHVINPFAGVSLGILGVARQGGGNLEYDAVWGVGALAGFEQSLGGTAKLFAKVEYARGLQQVPARTIGDQEFAGGTLAWLYITFGSRFSF